MPAEPRIGQVLPCAEKAIIPRAKLVDYALDPDHPDGGHKAMVFKSALAIERAQWRYLRRQILAGLPSNPVTTCHQAKAPAKRATWGVPMPITGLNGRT